MGRHQAFADLGIPAQTLVAHAIDHWELAVQTHGLNFPGVAVHQEDITKVTAATYGLEHIDLLWASPSCVHHSRARGGKPREEQQRSHAWEVVDRWLRVARVDVVLIENVPEFEQWGPLDADGQPIKDRRGEDFRAFVRDLQELGYRVEWRVLCAADYGDPTTRKRFFMQAVRDDRSIVWPQPTHRDPRKPAKPGQAHLPVWKSAASCIDWSLPCPSIFERKRPLAEATLRRIATGLVRFVLNGKPFVVGDRAHALVQTSYGERKGQAPRVLDLEQPLGTVVASGQKHGLVAVFLAKHYGGGPNGVQCPGIHPSMPMGTVTAWDHHGLARVTLGCADVRSRHVAAFLTQYFSHGGQGKRIDLPLHTVTTIEKHGLVTVTIDGSSYTITDIGLRMLKPHELARAMGFPDTFRWQHADGSPILKKDLVKMIGNACPVSTVRELIKAVVLQKPGAFGLREAA